MRSINKIIVHCAATTPKMDIGVKEIRVWHVEERGWSDIGYHYVIRKNGTVEVGRPIQRIGSHCRGQNSGSIGICYVGGHGGLDDRTEEQKCSLIDLIMTLRHDHGDLTVHGHSEFSAKTCPNFDASAEYND